MFRWGLLFWLHWLLWVLGLCIKKIFSCISNFIIKVMVLGCVAIYAITYFMGMSIADLVLLIWDFIGLIIDLIKRF